MLNGDHHFSIRILLQARGAVADQVTIVGIVVKEQSSVTSGFVQVTAS
jgi:hypothetical protein